MGWLEILLGKKQGLSADSDSTRMSYDEIFEQMRIDVARLQLVANRFGQIGSKPEWKEFNLDTLMEETAVYYKKRLPFNGKGIEIAYNNKSSVSSVRINGELFTWVIENLIKNALEAVNPQDGRIELSTHPSKDGDYVIIDVKDNGRGIPVGVARKIFRPGFTTKKRGWGLGLTLAKRIIEEYHRGRISLIRSRPGETIFRIVLPTREGARVKRFRQYA